MLSASAFLLIPALALPAVEPGAPAAKQRPAKAALELKSPAFASGAYIPGKYSCLGEDASPPLSWTRVPKGTKSFALVMDDPGAPAGAWVHWVIYDIPADKTGLSEGLSRTQALPDGAKQGRTWGVDEFEHVGYYGPCPPPGSTHRYSFRLYALDQVPGLPPRASKARLLEAMAGHVLAQAELAGLFQR